MKALVVNLISQYLGYVATITIFGNGVPTFTKFQANSFAWLFYSIPLMIYLIVCGVVLQNRIERLQRQNSINNREIAGSYILFALPGICSVPLFVIEQVARAGVTWPLLPDVICVLTIPALSLWFTRRFLANLAPKIPNPGVAPGPGPGLE